MNLNKNIERQLKYTRQRESLQRKKLLLDSYRIEHQGKVITVKLLYIVTVPNKLAQRCSTRELHVRLASLHSAQRMLTSVIKIQTWYRMIRQRLWLIKLKQKRQTAISRLQMHWRRMKQIMIIPRNLYQKQKQAAQCIQRYLKGYLVRRNILG